GGLGGGGHDGAAAIEAHAGVHGEAAHVRDADGGVIAAFLGVLVVPRDRVHARAGIVGDGPGAGVDGRPVPPVDGGAEIGGVVTGVGVREGRQPNGGRRCPFAGAEGRACLDAERRIGDGGAAGRGGGVAGRLRDDGGDGVRRAGRRLLGVGVGAGDG